MSMTNVAKLDSVCYYPRVMARKTKQEKIIADLRRKLRAQEERLTPITPKLSSRIKQETKTKSQPLVNTLTIPTDLIKKDLMKTLLLTIVAISLELVVYLIWR